MEIVQIPNEQDYQLILERIDKLFDAPADSPEATELGMLVSMVNKYESDHYPIDEPDPIEYEKIRKEEMKPIVSLAH